MASKFILAKEPFVQLLKKVHLGGTINDCVASFDDKHMLTEAIDLSSNVVINTRNIVLEKKAAENFTLGLGDIETLIKFCGTVKDELLKTTISGNRWKLSTKNRRSMHFLLSEPSLIPTTLDESGLTRRLFNDATYRVDLSKAFVEDYLKYIGLSRSKEVRLHKPEGGRIIVTIGAKNEHQFKVKINNDCEVISHEEKVELLLHGELLQKVLTVIDIEDDTASLYLAADRPILIADVDTEWAINPVIEEV